MVCLALVNQSLDFDPWIIYIIVKDGPFQLKVLNLVGFLITLLNLDSACMCSFSQSKLGSLIFELSRDDCN